MKTAYSYRRWSTRSQGDEGRDSRKRQTDSAEKWIAAHGNGQYYLSKEVFEDAGKSASKGKHIEVDAYGKAKGELIRFIQMVEAGKIQRDGLLLIDEFSRFSRLPVTKSIELFLRVINTGIGLVFTGSYDARIITMELVDKEPTILYPIIGEMIRSEREASDRSQKVKGALQRKKAAMQAGEKVSHNTIPKYFTYVPITKANGHYIHNDNTEIVRELVKGILAGKSLYAMTIDLNKRGIKTFRYGDNWHPCSVRQILRNPILKGEYLGNKDYVPAIIDETTFAKVQNILSKNKLNRGKKADLINIFRGICQCGFCGHQMNVMSQNKNEINYRYLRCSNYYAGGKDCRNNYIRLEPMEEDFFLKFIAKNPYKLINGDDTAEVATLQKQIIAKTTMLNLITGDISKAVELLDTLDLPELKTRLAKLNGERESIRNDLDELNMQINAIQGAPQDTEDWFMEITEFEGNEDGTDKVTTFKTVSKEYLEWFITNNEWREKVRVMLPSLLGNITIKDHKFFVFNRMGKAVFESVSYPSMRNTSEEWKNRVRKGIKKYWDNKKAKDERKKAK